MRNTICPQCLFGVVNACKRNQPENARFESGILYSYYNSVYLPRFSAILFGLASLQSRAETQMKQSVDLTNVNVIHSHNLRGAQNDLFIPKPGKYEDPSEDFSLIGRSYTEQANRNELNS